MPPLVIAFAHSMNDITSDNWHGLMGHQHPFTRHEFLLALEQSGSACDATGWKAQHLCVFDASQWINSALAEQELPNVITLNSQGLATVWLSQKNATHFNHLPLVGVMPLYQKNHSYGEYVFDWSWAQAYERHHLDYYPKLVSAIPFTPVVGKRLGVSATLSPAEQALVARAMQQALNAQLQDDNYPLPANSDKAMSSWHCLFVAPSQKPCFSGLDTDLDTDLDPESAQGLAADRGVNSNSGLASSAVLSNPLTNLHRLSTQFHWRNRGYRDFADFAGHLASRKRKNIVKERALVAAHHLHCRFVSGGHVTPAQWQGFIQCYQRTYLKRSGHVGYLTPGFFLQIAAQMPEQIVLLVVEDSAGQMHAGALYFIGENAAGESTLYGRYWGAMQEYEGLHFEACYYQGIEYCIAQGIKVFDAGAQGEHKVLRGFEPVALDSYHQIAHAGFREAIADFTQQEAVQMQLYMAQMRAVLPYKTRV